VPDGWPVHITWAAMALAIIAYGPGRLSLDHLISRALGLLVMTAIVELTVPDGWPIHITWAAMALGIMAYGPGRFSLDHWLNQLKAGGGRREDGR